MFFFPLKNWFLSWSTCCYLPPIDCWITLLFLASTSARDGSLITGIAIVVTCAKSDLISPFLVSFHMHKSLSFCMLLVLVLHYRWSWCGVGW